MVLARVPEGCGAVAWLSTSLDAYLIAKCLIPVAAKRVGDESSNYQNMTQSEQRV
jgi:hypothetical protein